MKKETEKKGMSAGTIIGIGAGVAALGAASFYFFGSEGKKHQKNFKAWMIKMKAEIVDKLEDAEDVTEAVYHKIVDTAASAYQKTGKATAEEVALYADVLKKQWKHIANFNKKPKKAAAKKKVVTPAKTIAKKVAPKKAVAKNK